MTPGENIRPCGVTPPTDEFADEIEVAEEIYRHVRSSQEDREAMWRTFCEIRDAPDGSESWEHTLAAIRGLEEARR